MQSTIPHSPNAILSNKTEVLVKAVSNETVLTGTSSFKWEYGKHQIFRLKMDSLHSRGDRRISHWRVGGMGYITTNSINQGTLYIIRHDKMMCYLFVPTI